MTAPPLPGTDTVAQVAGGVFSVPPHATAAQWQRFLARVAVTPGCWFWCGALGSDGAGRWRAEPGVTVRPHRWAYEAVHGPLPRDAAVSQTCGEPSCVRWDAHLRVRWGPSRRTRASGSRRVSAARARSIRDVLRGGYDPVRLAAVLADRDRYTAQLPLF